MLLLNWLADGDSIRKLCASSIMQGDKEGPDKTCNLARHGEDEAPFSDTALKLDTKSLENLASDTADHLRQ